MHIVFEESVTELLNRFTMLQLDTFCDPQTNRERVAYCLVENIPLGEMPQLQQQCALHQTLIENYQSGQWDMCESALEQLRGCWNQELDSFYDDLYRRVQQHRDQPTSQHWDYTLPRRFDTSG
jgi:hypothetical protein